MRPKMVKTSTDNSNGGAKSTPSVRGGQKKPINLGSHLVETAWRVAIPFFIFSLGGILLDVILDTEPWFTLIGVVVALSAVFAVVKRYIDQHFPDTFKRDKQ